MIVLVSGATRTVTALRGHPHLGRLITPQGWNDPAQLRGWTWAADNGAYSAWDAEAYIEMLARLRGLPGCCFVAVPDVVGSAVKTLERWETWAPAVRAYGLPLAYVGQDGQRASRVPWQDADAIFLGGTTEWKLSRDAVTMASYAKARGKWLHVGRVNTHRRLKIAHRLGADSVDGTAVSRWADVHLRKQLDVVEQLECSPRLM